jgi:hypothetical protein
MEFTKEQLKSFIEAVVCNVKDYVMNNDGFIDDWIEENIPKKSQPEKAIDYISTDELNKRKPLA